MNGEKIKLSKANEVTWNLQLKVPPILILYIYLSSSRANIMEKFLAINTKFVSI